MDAIEEMVGTTPIDPKTYEGWERLLAGERLGIDINTPWRRCARHRIAFRCEPWCPSRRAMRHGPAAVLRRFFLDLSNHLDNVGDRLRRPQVIHAPDDGKRNVGDLVPFSKCNGTAFHKLLALKCDIQHRARFDLPAVPFLASRNMQRQIFD